MGAAVLEVAVRLAIGSVLFLLSGCTNYRCYYPPEHDIFMTRCMLHLRYDDCEANAAFQGMGVKCVEEPRTTPSTTSHYSVAGQ